MMNLLLLNLPVELLLRILDLLDYRSLLRLSQTCSGLHTLIDSSTSFQYQIALGATNTSHSTIGTDANSLAQRLSEIRRREKAWMQLSCEEVVKTSMEWSSGVYELQHGLFVQGKRTSIVTQRSNGVRIMHLARSRSALASQSGTSASSASTMPPVIEYSLPFEFSDFNIDPSQDLAIYTCTDESSQLTAGPHNFPLVRNSIRLRRISHQGAPHPLACAETLDLGMAYQRGVSFFVQIYGDFVGVLIRSMSGIPSVRDASQLLVYNWKTGILQATCVRQHITNFIFLSPTHIMLVTNTSPYGLTICSSQPRTIRLFPGSSLDQVDIPPPKPVQSIASFLFPANHPAALMMTDLVCRCEPTPEWVEPEYSVEYAQLAVADINGDLAIRTSLEVLTSLTAIPPHHSDSPSERETYSYSSSPIVRPGISDFRIAVLTYTVRQERDTEDYVAFVAISELLKNAIRRLESESPPPSLDSGRSISRSSSFSPPSNPDPDSESNPNHNASEVPPRPTSPRLDRLLGGRTPSPLYTIPFTAWSSTHSRFLAGSLSSAWVCYVYLNRVVTLMPDPPLDAEEEEEEEDEDEGDDTDDEEGGGDQRRRMKEYLMVMDFNPHALKETYPALKGGKWDHNPSSSPSSSVETQKMFTSHVITSPAYTGLHSFSEPIKTSLPFRYLHSHEPIDASVGRTQRWVPMIDAERILLVPDDDGADSTNPPQFRTLAF